MQCFERVVRFRPKVLETLDGKARTTPIFVGIKKLEKLIFHTLQEDEQTVLSFCHNAQV